METEGDVASGCGRRLENGWGLERGLGFKSSAFLCFMCRYANWISERIVIPLPSGAWGFESLPAHLVWNIDIGLVDQQEDRCIFIAKVAGSNPAEVV